MTYNNIQTLKTRIAASLDVDEFLDILQYTIYDLVEIMEEQIREHQEEFEEVLK